MCDLFLTLSADSKFDLIPVGAQYDWERILPSVSVAQRLVLLNQRRAELRDVDLATDAAARAEWFCLIRTLDVCTIAHAGARAAEAAAAASARHAASAPVAANSETAPPVHDEGAWLPAHSTAPARAANGVGGDSNSIGGGDMGGMGFAGSSMNGNMVFATPDHTSDIAAGGESTDSGADREDAASVASSVAHTHVSTPAGVPSPCPPQCTCLRCSLAATVDDGLIDTHVPLCACGEPMRLLNFREGSYRHGWFCDDCPGTGRRKGERWICLPCRHDLCQECAANHLPGAVGLLWMSRTRACGCGCLVLTATSVADVQL